MYWRIVCSLVVLAGLAFGALPSASAAERRVALVIGNAKYKEAPLTNPVNDARDMAAALQRTGFEVIMAIDATQKEMNRAIAIFGDRLTADSVALFYYTGHGMQVRGKNYLIPIDAEIKSESSVRVESVDVDGVLDQLSTSDLNVVILDACRNNPFERRANRSVGAAGLAQMEAPKGSLIAYATAPGRTAADGDGRNGVYTQALLKYVEEPGLTIEQVFKNVRREVAKATRDGQIPWESSSMTADFYFIPGSGPPAGAKPTAPVVVAAQPVDGNGVVVGAAAPANFGGGGSGKKACVSRELAPFPWPHPPEPSDSALIAPYLLFPAGSKGKTLLEVARRLEGSIAAAGYHEPRYLGADCNGFAVVLDLEHIDPDGARKPGAAGFAPTTGEPGFTLARYIQHLFYAPPGYYRQIVFVVSDIGIATSTPATTPGALRAIAKDGSAALAPAYGRVPFTWKYKVVALVYEFQKGPADGDARQIPPTGRLRAPQHLMKAQLY